jgi:hypothetical protein
MGALEFRLASPADWRALVMTRANVLVIGPDDALGAFLTAARPALREPSSSLVSGAPVSPERVRTLILTDVHTMDADGQRALLAWLNDPPNADTQVVSLASVPLFSLVQAGTFDRELYYRLNTICLEIQQSTETYADARSPAADARGRAATPMALARKSRTG